MCRWKACRAFLCDVQCVRAIYCKYYYLVFRSVRTLQWRHLELAPGIFNRWRHTHTYTILIIAYVPMLFYVKKKLLVHINRKIVQTAWMAIYTCVLWPGSTKKMDNLTLFFLVVWRWFAVVCGGLSASLWFHCLSSQILVVICSGWRWFVVVCCGLRWFVVVCLLVIPAHTGPEKPFKIAVLVSNPDPPSDPVLVLLLFS